MKLRPPQSPRNQRGWALMKLLSILVAVVLDVGCGGGSNHDQGPAPVTLSLVMAGQQAQMPTTPTKWWAMLLRWLPGQAPVWAQSVNQIASIRVVVRGGETLLQTTVVPVSNPTSGQTITIQLNVAAGPDRSFSVLALDGTGAVLFSGCVRGVNLAPGVRADVTVTLVAGGSASCTGLRITTLGSGSQLNGPLGGIRVLRHDPITGTVLGDMTTDTNGVADFGDIDNLRTSFSFVTTRSDGRNVIVSFLNVGVGDLRVNLATNDAILPPTLTIGSVEITDVPVGTTRINLSAGGFTGLQFVIPPAQQPPFPLPDLPITQLQSDGLVSFLAEGSALSGQVVGCSGSQALDLPPVLSGTTSASVPIDTQSPPLLTTTYTSLTGEPVRVGSKQILRKGVIFETFPFSGPSSVGPTAFTHCGIADSEKTELVFQTDTNNSGFHKEFGVILNGAGGVPANVSFSMPDLTITSLTRNGQTFSWTTSGSALSQTDVASLELVWTVGSIPYEWKVLANPMVSSVTLPFLPGDLADRIPPPIVSTTLEIGGVNNAVGFADLTRRFFVSGDFDVGIKFAGATEEFTVTLQQ